MRLSHRLFLALLASAILWAEHLSASAADVVWTNTSGGTWATASNWSPNQVPGSADTAWITNNGTYTVTVNASATVNALKPGRDHRHTDAQPCQRHLHCDERRQRKPLRHFEPDRSYVGRIGVAGFGRPAELERGDHQRVGSVQWRHDWRPATLSLNGGTLVNTGTLTDSLSSGYASISMSGSAVISNLTGATFDLTAEREYS